MDWAVKEGTGKELTVRDGWSEVVGKELELSTAVPDIERGADTEGREEGVAIPVLVPLPPPPPTSNPGVVVRVGVPLDESVGDPEPLLKRDDWAEVVGERD